MSASAVRPSRDLRAWVVLLCAVGAAWSLHQLYLSLTRTGPAGVGSPIATLERRDTVVRRKAQRSALWSNVGQGEKLYTKDAIKTGEESFAAIQFEDGKTLELGPNSLIVLEDSKDLALNSLRGSAVVRGADGDQSITTGADGTRQVQNLTARLTEPQPRSVRLTSGKRPLAISFSWQLKAQSTTDLKLQVSSNRNFDRSGLKEADARNGAATLELPPGAYSWRLVSGGNVISETRGFEVLRFDGFEPLFPNAREGVTTWKSESSATFRWKNPLSQSAQAERLRQLQIQPELQIATDSEFQSVVHSTPVPLLADLSTVPPLKAGRYFWRISTKLGNEVRVSHVEDFDVRQLDKPKVSLKSPEADEAVQKVAPLGFSFTVEPSSVGTAEIQIRDSSGDTVESQRIGKDRSWVWKKARRGAFEWRVSLSDGEDRLVDTDWKKFSIGAERKLALETPREGEKIIVTGPKLNTLFRWNDPRAEESQSLRFQLEIAEDNEFKSIKITKILASPQWTLQDALPEATYFWRVSILGTNSAVVSASPPRSVVLAPPPLLAAPREFSPKTGEEQNLVKLKNKIELKWTPIEGAKSYRVTLTPAKGDPVVREGLQTPNLSFPKLKPGRYTWSVQAQDGWGRYGEATPPQTFDAVVGRILSAPKAISSEVQ